MKKLTASIFASLLTVVTVGAANANIASQGYVDEKVTTLNQSIGAKADQSALDTLSGRVDTAEGDIDTIQGTMGTYGDIVTKDAGDFATAAQGAKADTALQKSGELTEGNLLTTDASGNIIDAGAKGALASMDAVGSAQITDGSITSADISATAAIKKTQLETGVQTSLGLADTALQEGDLADYAKTAEVASTYETKANASATYETKTNAAATYATKEEIADLATDENLALKQDKADNNLATTNKTVVGAINEVKTTADDANSAASAAQSAASAADSKAQAAQSAAEAAQETADAAIPAPDGECSNPTNKCVLTYNNSAYAWEVIERGSNGQ